MSKFTTKAQKDVALERTKMIYRMADDVARLRLERNEHLSRERRRLKGASEAKAARIKQAASKWKHESVSAEQGMLSKLSLACDLVTMGSKSWSQFHGELNLGGQKETIIESMGGAVTMTVAGRAWKAAVAAAVKPGAPKKPTWTGLKCYWCGGDHLGKRCPRCNAGEQPSPGSRASKWSKSEIDKMLKRRAKPKVKVTRN